MLVIVLDVNFPKMEEVTEREHFHLFWAEAVSTAVYLRNRSATKAVDCMTPFESDAKPTYMFQR